MQKALERTLDEVGRHVLLAHFRRAKALRKADGSFVSVADLEAQQALKAELSRIAPHAAFLGEEDQNPKIPDAEMLWCVDPLDGTGNFVAGFPCFAVSAALLRRGRTVLACVFDPVRKECFSWREGDPPRLNGEPIHAVPAAPEEAIAFVDFKRLSPAQQAVFLTCGAIRSQRNLGSCALEWAWLAAGRAHLIVHGGQSVWDYAAGAAIALAAGAAASDFTGQPLFPLTALKRSVIAAGSAELIAHFRPQL